MLYLTGVASHPAIAAYAALEPRLGLMLQPRSGLASKVGAFSRWAADNGAYGAWARDEPFDPAPWARWLATLPAGALFAAVPDAVGDHDATLALWHQHLPVVLEARFPPAFVLQNGCTPAAVPWRDLDAVFVGGDTDWKLSRVAGYLVDVAHDRGKWVHMGRVNSTKRYLRALAMGCDSTDGTFLKYGEIGSMLDQVTEWLKAGVDRGGQTDILDATTT